MTNDLETMLRTSLHERADDVESTPELWQRVQRRVARRRAMPLLVWTAAGVAAVVTAVAVVPGLVDRMDDGLVIGPAQSPTVPASPGEVAPGPVAAAPLSHYVAVVDGRFVLRGVDGSEEVLWEGGSEVRTVAVRPGSTPEELTVAFVTAAEGMLELRLHSTDGEGTVPLGADPGEATPVPVWSPDGRTVAVVTTGGAGSGLLILSVEDLRDGDADLPAVPPAGVEEPGTGRRDPSALRLQDWTSGGGGEFLWFTSLGDLYRAPIGRVGEGWDVGVLQRTDDGEDYVVDIATASDGTQYRLLAGGSTTGDAEDAGLALEFDNERIAFPDLATASPADVWMTAVEGGAFVGLGNDARVVHRDPQGDSPHAPLTGVSYAAWVPVAGGTRDVPKGPPTAGSADTAGPADPASRSAVTPYVAIQESGRVAVVTGDGREREVIISEQQLADLGAGTPVDVTVRPASTADEVAGVLLLDGGDGRELAWFRAAAGATAIYRMEGATGLGSDGLEQRHAPTWSPDGRHIAWVEPSDDGGWTLRTVGMADDGPTTAHAGFGLDVDADDLVLAAWDWSESDGSQGTARGGIFLASPTGAETSSYVFPIERQGDGALAVTAPPMPVDVAETGVVDIGLRDHRPIELMRTADGYAVRFAGDADDVLTLPVPGETDPRALDLDVLERWVVVTDRASGTAYAVDLDGEVTVVDGAGREVHALDPVR